MTFDVKQESAMMQPIMDRQKPEDVAEQWLKDHPADMQKWLAGVSTFDGKDALATVQAKLAN
jgi:glycine betaine/proline transport system substrate-binding protein